MHLQLPSLGLLATSAIALSIPPQQIFSVDSELCPLAPKIEAPNDGLHAALKFLKDETIRSKQVDRLSRAVQVPTTVGDYVTDPYDEAFEPIVKFQELLKSLFPLTHSKARIDHINRLGLVFTLNGTSSLKPLLFMAHQDVVPIDSPSDWTYPPFAGHFDGEWLWGRGSGDCKNVLIGLLSVIEDLLEQNWTPTRTVVLAFGYDEESHGFLGAGSIAKALETKYGKDSFELILDEGGMGLEELGETIYALPGVGEKGSLDLILNLNVTGGHSSIPPQHTGIGIIAEIIYTLENNNLFTPLLSESHPTRRKLECQLAHSPSHVEPWLGAALSSPDQTQLAEAIASSRGDKFRFTLQTSQATDLIHGGVKTNALPEKISATVNYRIALHQTPAQIIARAISLITPIISKYNITLSDLTSPSRSPSPSSPSSPPTQNHLTLSTLVNPLNPAPKSPIDNPVWTRFAGVTRSVFESVPSLSGKTVVVTGDVMNGNTDTRFYWNLSRNIYRWGPSRAGGSLNIHTVDERVAVDVHLEGMMLYYDLIRAFDASTDEETLRGL